MELAEYTNIDRVDPQNMFHLPTPTKCEPAPIDPAEVAGCNADTDPKDVKALLLMSDGGSDLTAFDGWKTIDKSAFLLEVIRLFKGVELFVKNGYVHYDIKLANIVLKVSPDGMRLNYIDFGMMKPLEYVKTPDKETLGMWTYYPLDYYVIKQYISPQVSFDFVVNFQSRVTTVSPQIILADFTENKNSMLKPDEMRDRIASRFDSYQLGLALIQLLPHLELPSRLNQALFDLFYRMMHPNLMKRLWIEDATREYETILNNSVLRYPLTDTAAVVVQNLMQIPNFREKTPKYDKLEPVDLVLPPPQTEGDELNAKVKKIKISDSPVYPEPPISRGGANKRTRKRNKCVKMRTACMRKRRHYRDYALSHGWKKYTTPPSHMACDTGRKCSPHI